MSKTIQIFSVTMMTIAIITLGYFIERGLVNLRGNTRNVEVKGLAERDVEADIAVWDISFNISNESLAEAKKELELTEKVIREFLSSHDLKEENIRVTRLSVYQRKEQDERVGNITKYKSVFQIDQSMSVSTHNVRNIEKATQDTASLIEKGVILRNTNARYLFTKLNDIKPEMIAEATKAARQAADRFAIDSGSKVGSILRASQGWFKILPRYGGEYGEDRTIEKKVRVITTVDFLLNE